MAKATFYVQSFERRRGQLVPTTRDTAPTDNGALKRAEATAARVDGTAAISILLDDDTGEVRTATVLGTFGEVPEDFADRLLEG